MFCNYCGKEISEDSLFCRYCGKKTADEMQGEQRSSERRVKVFDFGGLSYNEGNIRKVNEWLQSQAISIDKILINTFMNTNFPIKWETVINRVEIQYYEIPTDKRYVMGYFKALKWIGTSFDRVSAAFENWKKMNSDKKVVWRRCMGHQASGGATQSLYFLYIR